MAELQLFIHPKHKVAKAAQRFFKERNIAFHTVDLTRRPIAPAELKRFIQHVGVEGVVDTTSKPYTQEGLAYLSTSEDGWIERMIANYELISLPLVRYGNILAVGHVPERWQEIADSIRTK